jgi:hypothetical protein
VSKRERERNREREREVCHETIGPIETIPLFKISSDFGFLPILFPFPKVKN